VLERLLGVEEPGVGGRCYGVYRGDLLIWTVSNLGANYVGVRRISDYKFGVCCAEGDVGVGSAMVDFKRLGQDAG